MPRRSILSIAERDSLLALPDTKEELIRQYTFSDTDLSIIRQRRGPANRLGFAVQLCYLRFPGVILGVDEPPFPPLLKHQCILRGRPNAGGQRVEFLVQRPYAFCLGDGSIAGHSWGSCQSSSQVLKMEAPPTPVRGRARQCL